MEYSASGLFGIYSNVTPYKEIVTHGETGYLTDNDSVSWQKAFEWAIKNKSRIKFRKNQLINMAEMQFNLEHEAQATISQIEKIIL